MGNTFRPPLTALHQCKVEGKRSKSMWQVRLRGAPMLAFFLSALGLLGLAVPPDSQAALARVPGYSTPKPKPSPTPKVTATPAPTPSIHVILRDVEVPEFSVCDNAAVGTCEWRLEGCGDASATYGSGATQCWIKGYIKSGDGACLEFTAPGLSSRLFLEEALNQDLIWFDVDRHGIDQGMEYKFGPDEPVEGDPDKLGKNKHLVNTLDPVFWDLKCGVKYRFNVLPVIPPNSCPANPDAALYEVLSELGCTKLRGKVVTIEVKCPPGPTPTPTPRVPTQPTPVVTQSPKPTPPSTPTPPPTHTPTPTPPPTPTAEPTDVPPPTPSPTPTPTPTPTRTPPPPVPGDICNCDPARVNRGNGSAPDFAASGLLGQLRPSSFNPRTNGASVALYDNTSGELLFEQSVSGSQFQSLGGNKWRFDGFGNSSRSGIETLQFGPRNNTHTHFHVSVFDTGLMALYNLPSNVRFRELRLVVSVPGNGNGSYVALGEARRSSEGNRWNISFGGCTVSD